MTDKFEQISTKSGFMKHNGGLLFKKISDNEFQFKSKVNSNHLNRAGITHGGYIASIIDQLFFIPPPELDTSPCLGFK